MLYHAKEPLPGAKVIEPERVDFVAEGMHYEVDVAYAQAEGHDLLMDCFFPKFHPGKLPVILWIHGGGWLSHELDRRYRPERELANLARLGFFVASIDYRLADEAPFPAQLIDCRRAVRYLKRHAQELQIDPEHIAVWGESAGAHLALLTAMTGSVEQMEGEEEVQGVSAQVQCAVSWYAPCELKSLQAYYAQTETGRSIVEALVGCDAGDEAFSALADAASPQHYVGYACPPILLLHGDRDSLVPYSQSENLYRALLKAGHNARLITVHDQGHGFFEGKEYMTAIENFLFEHLCGQDRAKLLHEGEGGHVVWEKEPDYAGEGVRYLPDQVFASPSGIELKADWMIPENRGEEKLPVIIWFHGGGWRSEELDRHYRPHGLLMQLCNAGFACVSADYRLLQQAAYPAPIQDARCAVRYVRACAEELNLDAEHIGVMGESAGAATAQLLGVGEYLPQHEGDGGYAEYSSRVQAVCSWYGFSNYIKSAQLTGMKAQRTLGVEYDYDGEGAKAMWKESTIAYADRPLPPFLLLHGTADPLVPSWQSIDMYKELISWGNEAELYMVPGEVHGFFTSLQAREKIVRFFRKHLMGRE